MMNRAFMIGALGAAAALSACKSNRPLHEEAQPTPEAQPVNTPPRPSPDVQGTFIGTLRGGMMGIGGEHTGWVLQGLDDGRGGGMMVDVSGVRDAAQGLEGQAVTIRGRVEERRYVERGVVKVLIAESISARED